jgi:hypothetical protein
LGALSIHLQQDNQEAKVHQNAQLVVLKVSGTHADVRFSAIVAAFGMRLAGSEHLNGLSYDAIESIAASSLGIDAGGHRSEFVGLVRRARELSPAETPLPVQSHGTSQE